MLAVENFGEFGKLSLNLAKFLYPPEIIYIAQSLKMIACDF